MDLARMTSCLRIRNLAVLEAGLRGSRGLPPTIRLKIRITCVHGLVALVYQF